MNDLDRLAKEKYNGDLRAAWRYVLYEASEEERARYTKYVSLKQLDIGMTALKRGDSNEIDALADREFNGDLKKTWDYIFSTCSSEEIDRYVSMADPYQAGQAFLLVNGINDKRIRKVVRKKEKTDSFLLALHLSREDVHNAKKNPYSIPLLKSILKVVFMIAVIMGLTINKMNMGMDEDTFNAVIKILGIITSCFAFAVADKLRDYFRFRSVKKVLEKEKV